MKILFPVALFLTAFLISCASPKPLIGTEGNSEIKESTIFSGEVSMKLYSAHKLDTVESSIEYMFYVDPQLPYQDSVNRIIKEYIAGVVSDGGAVVEQDSQLNVEYIEKAINEFRDAYYSEMDLYEEDEYFGGVWSTETTASILEGKSNYVGISFFNWNYSGGAHGNSWSEERLIEKKTGRELKLSDFFTDLVELSSIAEVIFRADQEIPVNVSTEDAGFWFENGLFHLNENFVFNGESIDFLYNQYEIAPYAAGMIYLSIPMDKIQHLLKSEVD